MQGTSFFFGDFNDAPRAARRVAEALLNPEKQKHFYRNMGPAICGVIMVVDGNVLTPARLGGRVAVSVEVGGQVIYTDVTVPELARFTDAGYDHIARNGKGDPEAYLRSLCSGTAEEFSAKAREALEVALAMAMTHPDTIEALVGQKEWVSVAEVPDKDDIKRLSVASGACLCLEAAPKK
jgi:hypothetical protein